MKKFAMVLAIAAGAVSASFAGGACSKSCNSCPKGYYPGQTFTTNCGVSCKPACKPCKPACKPVCAPVACKPVCKPACGPVCR